MLRLGGAKVDTSGAHTREYSICGTVILKTGWEKGLKRAEEWKYLTSECHHVLPLSRGGSDESENLICLCPTCHRKFHSGEFRLKQKANSIILQDELLGHQSDLLYYKHRIIL